MASCVIYLTAFLLAIGAASALKCYSCSGFTCSYGLLSFSYPEIDCDARSGNALMDTLSSIAPSQCVKIVGKDGNGKDFIVRNCTTYTSQLGCNMVASVMELGSDLKDMECYTCRENLCNSAPKFTGMTAVGLIIACFIFLF